MAFKKVPDSHPDPVEEWLPVIAEQAGIAQVWLLDRYDEVEFFLSEMGWRTGAAGVLICLLGLFVLRRAMRRARHVIRLHWRGARTKGFVIRTERYPREEYSLKIRFVDRDGISHVFDATQRSSYDRLGDEVPVRYDARNPGMADWATRKGRSIRRYVFRAIFGAGLIAYGVLGGAGLEAALASLLP